MKTFQNTLNTPLVSVIIPAYKADFLFLKPESLSSLKIVKTYNF
ncbi:MULTISPECIES: hypothetical protein [unclassified Microcoleus]